MSNYFTTKVETELFEDKNFTASFKLTPVTV